MIYQYQTPVLVKSFQVDTSATPGQVVTFSGVNAGNLAVAASGTYQVGVVYSGGTDENNYAPVLLMGVVSVQSDGSGTIAAGDKVAVSSNGQVRATTLSGDNLVVLGVALNSAPATAGALFDVLIK